MAVRPVVDEEGGVGVVCWKAATVETGKTTGREVGKWWVQIAPLAGIRGCCLNFSVKCRLRGAYGRTLVAFFCFVFVVERNRAYGWDNVERQEKMKLRR